MPCFEWVLGVGITDIFEEEDEPLLTIANEGHQDKPAGQLVLEMEADPEDGENNVLNENPVDMQDGDELIEEVIPAPNNDEGLIIVPEDNIVSEDELFVESDDDNDT